MRRIAHLTTVHQRYDVRIFEKECSSLAGLGYDVHLFVADGNGEETRAGVRIHDVGAARGRLQRILLRPWRMLRMARRAAADLYHLHDPELLPIGLFLRWSGAQVLYDAHEDVPRSILSKTWIRPAMRRAVATVFEWFENFAARRLAGVVAATPHIARRFARLNRRAVAVNNYPLAHELVDVGGARRDPRTLCYVGGITRIRGAVEMVRALEQLEARLLLAGPFEHGAMEAELRALPGWAKVEYRGNVSRAEVREIMALSSAGLLFFHPEPNHLEAQPNKMFEYMSAGLPVLASDFPLWQSLLNAAGAGRCADPLDPAAIARVIAETLADPAAARAMGERGRKAVQHTYQWAREEGKLHLLYQEVLA